MLKSRCVYRYVMVNVFLTCTCWLTVAVTVERFLSLRFMMHPRILCSTSRAKRAIIAIFLASFLFHFSKFFEYVPNLNLSQPEPWLPTELSKNANYDKAMHFINISLAALVPIVALVIFNTFLIYFLATHRRRMLKHKSVSASGATVGGTTSVDMLHVSGVVVAVVLVFVVCHSLGVFLAINIAMHGRHKIFSDYLFLTFKHVNGFLIVVNSSINFILYYSISRKFRKMFGSVFCQRLLSGKNSSWSVPMPLSENSMATAVSVRTANTNGYTRANGDHAKGSETFALHPSASTTSSRRSDNVEL